MLNYIKYTLYSTFTVYLTCVVYLIKILIHRNLLEVSDAGGLPRAGSHSSLTSLKRGNSLRQDLFRHSLQALNRSAGKCMLHAGGFFYH